MEEEYYRKLWAKRQDNERDDKVIETMKKIYG